MKSKTETFYICEYCGEKFNDVEECGAHEFSCKKKKDNEVIIHEFVGNFYLSNMAGNIVKNEIYSYLHDDGRYYDTEDHLFVVNKKDINQHEISIDCNSIHFRMCVIANSGYSPEEVVNVFKYQLSHKLYEISEMIDRNRFNLKIDKVNI